MKHMRRGKVLNRKTRLLSFFTVLRLHNPPAFPVRFWWSVLLGIVKVSICWVMLHPFGFSFCFSSFWVWDFKFMLFSFYTIFSTELVNSGTYNHHEIQNIVDLMEKSSACKVFSPNLNATCLLLFLDLELQHRLSWLYFNEQPPPTLHTFFS